MSFDPDIIDAMVAAGMSPLMIAAVYRAYCAKRLAKSEGATEGATGATGCNVAPSVAPSSPVAPSTSKAAATNTQRSDTRRAELAKRGLPAKYRGTLKAAGGCNEGATGATLHPVAPPLSLKKENLDSLREREGATLHPVAPVAPSTAIPLTEGWEPDANGQALGVAMLGAVGAANCLANFRDHFGASGKLMTAAQWQARFRVWVRNERGRVSSGQSPLPLMRSVAARDDADHMWKFERSYQETMARRRESG